MRSGFMAALSVLLIVLSGCGSSDRGATGDDLGLRTPGTLLVGSDLSYAPFEFTAAGSDQARGFDIDLVNAVADQMGISRVVVRQESFDTLLASTTTGNVDMAAGALTITFQRRQSVAFSSPYFEAGQAIVTRTDGVVSGPAFDGRTIRRRVAAAGLAGRTVGVQRGTTGDDLAALFHDTNVVRFDSADEAFGALAAGRVDAVIFDSAMSDHRMLAQPGFTVIAKVRPTQRYGFAFPPDNAALREAFDRGLTAVMANGTYAAIYRKWFAGEPPARFTG